MQRSNDAGAVVNCMSVKDYFRQQVSDAIDDEKLAVAEETRAYLVNLLSFYARTDHFFEYTAEGIGLRPLALVYGEALNAPTSMERAAGLRRVGDVAMFLAGVFRHGLRRKSVGVDYYIAIGGTAYGHLSNDCAHKGYEVGSVFEELGTKFAQLAEVLARACEQDLNKDINLLEIYERWQRTGSLRCARQLREAGISLGFMSARAH